jgi:hypothetical protein
MEDMEGRKEGLEGRKEGALNADQRTQSRGRIRFSV